VKKDIIRQPGAFKGNKQHLPVKICHVCRREFSWRRKWKTCWDEVKYCSTRCRHKKIPG